MIAAAMYVRLHRGADVCNRPHGQV